MNSMPRRSGEGKGSSVERVVLEEAGVGAEEVVVVAIGRREVVEQRSGNTGNYCSMVSMSRRFLLKVVVKPHTCAA